MLQDFPTWSVSRSETNTFSELTNSTLAIEASFYLSRLLTQSAKEPLLSALGGLPFALKQHIINELELLREKEITPLFVFDGLDLGKKGEREIWEKSGDAAVLNREAWELYNQHQAEKAVDTFGSSGWVKPQDYYRLLQSILHAQKLEFLVAPYSAWGQMTHILKGSDGEGYVDAIAGASELLLFDVERVITQLDFERKEFTWITRQACLEELGLTSTDMLVDTFMLSGSSLLPTLPTLNTIVARRTGKVRAAVELIKTHGQSGISVCTHFQEEPSIKNSDYLDLYRRNRLAVKHQVILTTNGKVEPFANGQVPSDLHEIVGQRLPEELYYYLSLAAIGPRILNHITSQQIFETSPPDGGESEEYHTLVRDKLTPIRALTLSLLARSLTRAYLHRSVKLRCWFDDTGDTTISLTDIPSPTPIIEGWNVRGDVLLQGGEYSPENITLSFAVKSLSSPAFAEKTMTRRDLSELLSTKPEILSNTIYRFLHLRGYTNQNHQLTPWGKVLFAMLPGASPTTPHTSTHTSTTEEAALLATELLRHDLLSSALMFPTYSGAPIRGTESDKRNCLLVSRIACLGKLQHQNIGFTGPLSRHLLGYSSMINAVRYSLRDLLETSLVTLLMSGDAQRESVDLTDVGLSLPLLLPSDCSLGIATKQYLDELSAFSDLSTTVKEEIIRKGTKDWFPFSKDFKGDLERAFGIWDGVYKGVKVAAEEGLVSGEFKETWDEVDRWLGERR